jgi:hypothetical protein
MLSSTELPRPGLIIFNSTKNDSVITFLNVKNHAPVRTTPTQNKQNYHQMCEDFAPNSGDKRTGCCIMTMHQLTLPFSLGNF